MLPENFFEKLAEKDILFKKGRVKGLLEGMEKGMEKGIVKGRVKGRVEGIVKGRAQREKEVAQLMKKDGLEKEFIYKITNVPISVINNL